MGKIPTELRDAIAGNIKEERLKKFPERGGGKKCAEAIGVSPQQWSPWERGMRVPDEERLKAIAKFFDVTVEYLRRPREQKNVPFEQWQDGIRLTTEAGQGAACDLNPAAGQPSENPHPTDNTPGLAAKKRRAVEAFCRCIYDMIPLGIRVDVAPILSCKEQDETDPRRHGHV